MAKSKLSKMASEMGKKGGRQRAKNLKKLLTPEAMSEHMRAVVNARWHPKDESKAS